MVKLGPVFLGRVILGRADSGAGCAGGGVLIEQRRASARTNGQRGYVVVKGGRRGFEAGSVLSGINETVGAETRAGRGAVVRRWFVVVSAVELPLEVCGGQRARMKVAL